MLTDYKNQKPNVIMAAVQLRKETEDLDETQIEHRKQNLKAAGAFIYAGLKVSEMQSEQAVILTHLKESKAYLEEGYTKFADYVTNELSISIAKADELVKQVHKLGENNYVALNKLGVGYRAMRALRQGIDEDRVEIDDQGEVIEIDGEIIEIKLENSKTIKELIKKLKDSTTVLSENILEKEKETEELKEKYEKATTIRDLELEEFTEACNAFHIKIQGELNHLQKLFKQSKLSLQKTAVFHGLILQLNELNASNYDYYVHGIIDTESEKKNSKKK